MNRRSRSFDCTHIAVILLILFAFRLGNSIAIAEVVDNPLQRSEYDPLPENSDAYQDNNTVKSIPVYIDPENVEAEVPPQAGASEAPEITENEGDVTKRKYREMADDFQEMVSKKLKASANWLDSFFRDERIEIEENKSTLRLRFSSFLEDGAGIDLNTRVRLRLVLPELEDKFHIEISGERDPNKDTTGKYDGLTEKRGEFGAREDKNWNLALRYFIETAREKNFSFNLGAHLNDLTPVIYGGPRYSASKDFDSWLFRFTQELQWYTDEGWESKTGIDFERPLTEKLFFRTSTDGSWYQDEDGYFYDINFILYQILDKDRVFKYAWSNFFKTRPNHELDEILLWTEYRQRFWREWLFFQVRPQVAFREKDGFDPTTGITFAVEALFGEKSY